MRIAFATAELAPHAHVGGLGDVARALPGALVSGGDDVTVFLPRYDVLDLAGRSESLALESVDLGGLGSATITRLEGPGPRILLVNAPRWFATGAIYGSADRAHLGYAALGRALVAACDALEWMPDLIHANDWHTALLPLHAASSGGDWAEVATVLTIHNLAYQGSFPLADLGATGIDPGHPLVASSIHTVNPLRVGIQAADIVTTVSPTYAREVLSPERGSGLDDVLRDLGDRLVGILNGIGDEWNPATDPFLPRCYDAASLDLKTESTAALRTRLGLVQDPGIPVLGVVSRLAEQKGLDLLGTVLPPLLDAGRAQLAVLGSGDPGLERMFESLANRFPTAVGTSREFDPALAHLIEAGADVFLMPSQWEPCGLNQMYSQRYGTVPVVHRTGGLADTVSDWDAATGTGTGFLFDRFDAKAFAASLAEALTAFEDRAQWRRLQHNGMAQDFSWSRRAQEYRSAYTRALEMRKARS